MKLKVICILCGCFSILSPDLCAQLSTQPPPLEDAPDLATPHLGATTGSPPVCLAPGPDNLISLSLLADTVIRSGDLTGLYAQDGCRLVLGVDNEGSEYGMIVEYSLSMDVPVTILVDMQFKHRIFHLAVSLKRTQGGFEEIDILAPDSTGRILDSVAVLDPSLYRQANGHLLVKYQILETMHFGGRFSSEDDVDYEWGDIDPD